MKPLSLYGNTSFKRADAAAMMFALRDWYFEHGMFLSGRGRGTRYRYFALQEALVLVTASGDAGDVLARESDPIKHIQAEQDQRACDSFSHAEAALPSWVSTAPFMQYRFLRALGSLLRTETVNDVHTRAPAQRMADLDA